MEYYLTSMENYDLLGWKGNLKKNLCDNTKGGLGAMLGFHSQTARIQLEPARTDNGICWKNKMASTLPRCEKSQQLSVPVAHTLTTGQTLFML